jgi:flagellar hook protein FlgE
MGINSSLYIGVSGLSSFGSALAVVSDNVANANTTGFKGSNVRFGDMVSSFYATQSQDTDRAGSGSNILGIATNFGQGPIVGTASWTDLAINGDGFFNMQLVDSSGGLSGQIYYTRDGSFHVNSSGYLVNSQGYAVLDSTGAPLQAEPTPSDPTYTNYTFDAGGQLHGSYTRDDATAVPPITAGTFTNIGNPLQISLFPNQEGLIRQGANLFSIGPEAGAPYNTVANTASTGQILGCNIEGSNVDLASEMVNMIIYQADYNANSKSITTGDNMLNTVINLIR